jgi:hypothetical protein
MADLISVIGDGHRRCSVPMSIGSIYEMFKDSFKVAQCNDGWFIIGTPCEVINEIVSGACATAVKNAWMRVGREAISPERMWDSNVKYLSVIKGWSVVPTQYYDTIIIYSIPDVMAMEHTLTRTAEEIYGFLVKEDITVMKAAIIKALKEKQNWILKYSGMFGIVLMLEKAYKTDWKYCQDFMKLGDPIVWSSEGQQGLKIKTPYRFHFTTARDATMMKSGKLSLVARGISGYQHQFFAIRKALEYHL